MTTLTIEQGAVAACTVTPHQTMKIEGANIFYREAGAADAPAVLLLHSFPTSSHMFRNLIPTLADLVYPAVQAYFRERRPPTLIVWGKNDKIFPADRAHPYTRDLPDVEFHLIDTGHFALEDKADEIVPVMLDFVGRKVAPQ
jgi:pimeloyl-ACP methyl ester carboxylesterase